MKITSLPRADLEIIIIIIIIYRAVENDQLYAVHITLESLYSPFNEVHV